MSRKLKKRKSGVSPGHLFNGTFQIFLPNAFHTFVCRCCQCVAVEGSQFEPKPSFMIRFSLIISFCKNILNCNKYKVVAVNASHLTYLKKTIFLINCAINFYFSSIKKMKFSQYMFGLFCTKTVSFKKIAAAQKGASNRKSKS